MLMILQHEDPDPRAEGPVVHSHNSSIVIILMIISRYYIITKMCAPTTASAVFTMPVAMWLSAWWYFRLTGTSKPCMFNDESKHNIVIVVVLVILYYSTDIVLGYI